MGTNDTYDANATTHPTSSSPEPPLLIVPATQPPIDLAPTVLSPVAALPDGVHLPTEEIPVVPAAPPTTVVEVSAPAYVPPAVQYETVPYEAVPYVADRRPAWPHVAALVALLLGGLAGYVIGAAAGDDGGTAAPAATVVGAPGTDATLDMLLARTRADGEYRSPSDYAQLDEITEIDNAKATEELRAQVDLLTDDGEDVAGLTEQVALLGTALADVTAERDALLTDAGADDGIATGLQAEFDAANATIDEINDDLTEANTDLEAANATIVERDAAITTLQAQLDTADRTLADLNVLPVPSYINGDIARARADAAANGWTLIEQPTVAASSRVGVVLDQAPVANSNMINGSVLYVEVATRS